MTIYGFTGTRKGMSDCQSQTLCGLLCPGDTVHHGDAIGADKQAHYIARGKGCKVVIHPCNIKTQRAFCKGDEVYDAKEPLDRNHDIVDACDVLIATPETMCEQLRSGTWATIRYAKKIGKRVRILER